MAKDQNINMNQDIICNIPIYPSILKICRRFNEFITNKYIIICVVLPNCIKKPLIFLWLVVNADIDNK